MSDHRTEGQVSTSKVLKRRGILAAAGAAVAGLLAKTASDTTPAGATNNDILHIGTSSNSGNTIATVIITDINSAPPGGSFAWANRGQADAIQGRNSSGGTAGTAAVRGEIAPGGLGSGVIGSFGTVSPTVSSGNGVYGFADSSGGTGISGRCDNAFGVGVFGESSSYYGVHGTTATGIGVVGEANPGGGGTSNIGVYGFSATGNGVYGTTSGTGLVAGLYGTSTTAYGILGNTTAPFYSGLTATTSTANCAALAATSTNASAFAAYFSGFTYVQGNFAVSGNKSAAVMHPDGTRRLLYCVESPEAWFEDFGTGKLVGGRAEVKLDPDFAVLVQTSDYHVFPVSHDATSKGLAVTAHKADGFTVQELGGGTSSGSFSWRVVAKRKDNPGKRLEKLNVPKFNLPDPDKLPKSAPPRKP